MRRSSSSSSRRRSSSDSLFSYDKKRTRRRRLRRWQRRSPAWMNCVRTLCGWLVLLLGGILVLRWTAAPSSVARDRLQRSSPSEASDGIHDDNDQSEKEEPASFTFHRFTNQAPACNALSAEQVSYTLVTQLSMDRFWMMEHHCQRWNNSSPLSVAILVDDSSSGELTTQESLTASLVQFGCDASLLTVQTLAAKNYPPDDYPVNVLRNLALAAVRTSHVFYVDIDFWTSHDLHSILTLPSITHALAQDDQLALVIPAFQLQRQCREWKDCREQNIPQMPYTRDQLLQLLLHKKASTFDPTNRGGHGSTRYQKWVKDQKIPGSLLEIDCVQSHRYEPYLVFRYCHETPPFQTAFSGYGKNKMTTVMHMVRSGFRFSQVGGAYVVHYPHLDSKSREEWNEGPKALRGHSPDQVEHINWTAYKRGRVDALFVDFRQWLASEVPDQTRVPPCDAAQQDDARLWYDRDKVNHN